MPTWVILATLLVLAAAAHQLGRTRAVGQTAGGTRLHSLPVYYGTYVALWCALPALGVLCLWAVAQGPVLDNIVVADMPQQYQSLEGGERTLLMNNLHNTASGLVSGQADPAIQAAAERLNGLREVVSWAMAVIVLAVAVIGLVWARGRVMPDFRARPSVERLVKAMLIIASAVAILTTVGIVLSLLFESIRFFGKVSIFEFLFGLTWSPQTALRADQVGSSGAFGAVPLFAGTLLITVIAILVAGPIGLMSAIYLSEYADQRVRSVLKPVLEILAGIPTVVFGFFAALTVAPAIRGFGESLGLSVASESALAAGVVMGIMIIPFISSLSDDVMTAVPRAMRDGSLAMGATRSETIRRVIMPAALPGIVGAFLLAISRAIGETMIVVMAAGMGANLTANPLDAVTTVTVQIKALLVGDQEFDSAKTLSAFALGLVLFLITLSLNVIALRIVRKFREQYE